MGCRLLIPFLILSLSPACSEKKKATRVACVGDSITWGHKIDERETHSYPAQLQQILGTGFEVQNFAANGLTLMKSGSLPVWESPIFDQALHSTSDIVIIQLGSNDIKRGNWKHKEHFIPDYTELIAKFRALPSHPHLFIALPTPAFPEAFGISNSVMEAELLPLISQIADQNNVTLIDVHTPLMQRPDCFPDNVHPNAEGARLLAEIIAPHVKEHLASSRN